MKQSLLFLLLLGFFLQTASAAVSFNPGGQAVSARFSLPQDIADRLAAEIKAAPFEYLDYPPPPALPDFVLEVDGMSYWCHLKDVLFVVPSDRPGHAKIKRIPAIGYLSKKLDGGGGKRVFLKDKNLSQTVIKILREYYEKPVGKAATPKAPEKPQLK